MSDLYDVAIIGSGPAGMSAAGQAAKRGMSHILLEKTDHLSDTIFKYQNGFSMIASRFIVDFITNYTIRVCVTK